MAKTNYMFLEKTRQRVSIHAKAGVYQWIIGSDTYEIPAAIERILIYTVYVGHPDFNFYELARLNLPSEVAANKNPEFLRSSFMADHQAEDITEYDYSMIPLYSDLIEGLWLYGDGQTWSLWITADDEKAILSKLNANTPWLSCKRRLQSVVKRYSMDLDDEFITLAAKSFYIQHGIDPNLIKKKEEDIDFKGILIYSL